MNNKTELLKALKEAWFKLIDTKAITLLIIFGILALMQIIKLSINIIEQKKVSTSK